MGEHEQALIDERSAELFAKLPDPSAREGLVHLYYPLVEYLARRFRSRGEPIDDLIQVASIGLLKAIDRFDTERGVKFSTYAVPTIIGELKRHFRDTGWAMRVPRRLQERALLLRTVISSAYQELGRSPTVSEIAKRAGLTDEEVLEAMDTMHAHSLESLDTPSEGDEKSPMHAVGAEDDTLEILEGWANVAPLLRTLPERERSLLYYRFVCGMPQSQIADKLGISQMHVSRLLAKTLSTLRKAVGEVES
ncbi:MAG TPA: SigB/SigF/SigG family RNA polymerase sigma factor [Actinomycetota bacterium]|nr:SigB/SigF/SigG family RNA polymerase sigma factor [Actinomycetota bacterium]